MSTVDEYLQELDELSREAFERVRGFAVDVVPGAGQGRSYGMAALTHGGKPLLGFSAAKHHLSVFPFSPAAVDAARPLLDGYDVSKGTVRFTPDHPLPEEAVRVMVAARVAEIDGRS